MPNELTRGDSLREFLSGAGSDGGSQADPDASLGGFRSSTEAVSLGIAITGSLPGVSVLYAGGANPEGDGTLTAIDGTHLLWAPFGSTSEGPSTTFSGVADTKIVEGPNPGQYLRVIGTTPFNPGACTVSLSYIYNNVFGFDNISSANASAGITEYRSTIIKNVSAGLVSALKRWIATLGTSNISNSNWLSGSGGGTISTTGDFSDWPSTGWCHIQTSGGITKEVVYYTLRSSTGLIVPAAGRGLLGTSASAGAASDRIYPVPGIAIGMDIAGVQASGSSIQTIASPTTPPSSIVWKVGITESTGLNIGSLSSGYQVGVWVKRHCPAGLVATPSALIKTNNSFNAF